MFNYFNDEIGSAECFSDLIYLLLVELLLSNSKLTTIIKAQSVSLNKKKKKISFYLVLS